MMRADPPHARSQNNLTTGADAPQSSAPPLELDDLDARLAEFDDSSDWTPRVGRRSLGEKLAAGLRGLKHALRGDSSFFAHAYRGLFVALTATLIGIGPHQWCVMLLAAGLVLVAELAHSSVDTLARALGDAEAPGPTVAREIATAGVLVSVLIFIAVAVIIFVSRMTDLYGW
jgi:diacylglycerol kinase (ATP)